MLIFSILLKLLLLLVLKRFRILGKAENMQTSESAEMAQAEPLHFSRQ